MQREEKRVREKKERVEEEGRWRGEGMRYVEIGGNGGQRKGEREEEEREEEGQEERWDETEVGGEGKSEEGEREEEEEMVSKSQDKESGTMALILEMHKIKLQHIERAFSRYLYTYNSTTLHCTIEQC